MSHGPPGLARGHLAPSQVVPDTREQRLAAGHLPVSQQLGEHVMYRQCVEDVTRREESYIESEGWTGHSAQHSAIMDHLDTPGVGQHLEVILSRLSSPVLATSSRSICPLTPTSFELRSFSTASSNMSPSLLMKYSVDGVSMEGGEAGEVHRQSRALLATMSVNCKNIMKG